jgi:hypothetical protein
MVNFSSEKWFSESSFYPYEIEQSCRFSKANSASLSRAPSSAGNKKTFTWSGWVKFCNSASYRLFGSGTSATEITDFHMNGSDGTLRFRDRQSGDNLRKETTAALRDVGAWHHIVCAVDVTQGSNSNRVKIYINGTLQTAFDTDDTFVNRNTYINRTGGNGMVLGKRAYDSASLLDGYMAEVHFVDGTQLTADSFGETKEGVWIPKAYTGSYGTNGFYLKFDQTGTGTASASTIGADSSGNNNHFTTSGFASIDSNRTDSPTNNFATWNAAWAYSSTYATTGTLLNGALALSSSGSATSAWSTFLLPSSGKYYVEMRTSSTVSSNFVCGVMSTDGNVNRSVLFQTDGTIDLDNAQNQSGLASWVDGNTVGILLNMDGGSSGFGEIAFYLQNSAYGNAVSISSATSPYALMTYGQTYVDLRTDERDFAYSIPDGYSTLSTANLPEPTISPLNGKQPSDYFNTVLYSGNDSTNAITGVNFQPDLVWLKRRSGTNAHQLYDAIRGAGKVLHPNTNDGEADETAFNSFDTDGFEVDGGSNSHNASGETYVAWNWLAGNGTTTNDASSTGVGSTDSVYSVNTTAKCSIVTYTGTGSATTIAHGLGAKPNTIWIKRRTVADYGNWSIYVDSPNMGAGKSIYFDLNNAAGTSSSMMNDTEPTSSVFTVNTSSGTNTNTHEYVAFCFSNVEGYSKFGEYAGNASAEGPFVYTGFRPAWILLKNVADAEWWSLFDNKRLGYNEVNSILSPNDTNQEYAAGGGGIDILSNGFKIRGTSGNFNGSGDAHIYMAFAEMPFKYANGR